MHDEHPRARPGSGAEELETTEPNAPEEGELDEEDLDDEDEDLEDEDDDLDVDDED